MRNTEELLLVEKAQSGDQGAFGELVSRHHRDVYLTVYSRILDREAAEDITQEAFLKAMLSLGQLRSAHRFRQWVRRIAINICIDHVRRQSKFSELLELCVTNEERSLLSFIPAEEHYDHLTEAIRSLTEINRQVVWLHYLDELSYADIADKLGITASRVRSRLHEARQQLRTILQPIGPPLLMEDFSTQSEALSRWSVRRPLSEEDPRKYQVVDVENCPALRLVEYGESSANLWTSLCVRDFALNTYVKATQADASWCISTHTQLNSSSFNDLGFESVNLSYDGLMFQLSSGRSHHGGQPNVVDVNSKPSVIEDGQFHYYQIRRSGGQIEVLRDGIPLVSGNDYGQAKIVGALQLSGTGHFQGDGVGAYFDGLVVRGI